MRPWASSNRLGLNSCRYSSVHGRPRLPRSRRTSSTVSAFCITHTSLLFEYPSPGPLRPADGVTVLPGRSLLLRLDAASLLVRVLVREPLPWLFPAITYGRSSRPQGVQLRNLGRLVNQLNHVRHDPCS